jgi:hypothetical protein
MSEVLYELVSASNFSERVTQIFHKSTRSIIGWESTDFAVPPLDLLFKLEAVTFVTELYLHPKKHKPIRALEVLISEDNHDYASIAKVFDLNDAARVEISTKCRYIKIVIADRDQGKPASLDLFRIYGHPYFKYHDDHLYHTQKKDKVEEVLMQYGFNAHDDWDADKETLVTLHDMSQLQAQYASQGQREKLAMLEKDLKAVIRLGKQIKQLETEKQFKNAKSEFE